MIKIKEAIVVEGRYDKAKLSNIFDTLIIETNGFGIFKDKKKQKYIADISKKIGVIIFTDSDGAGFVIRNFIKNICKDGQLYNAYIPDVYGKEKRKNEASKEGKLGVEGIEDEIIIKAVSIAAKTDEQGEKQEKITTSDMMELGLVGGENSTFLRKRISEKLQLPEHITGKAFLKMINILYSYEQLIEEVEIIINEKEGKE